MQPIFTMKCTAVRNGSHPLGYLDLEIKVSNGLLVINPSLNKEVVPLNVSSAHPSFVHRAWPVGLAIRNYTLSAVWQRSSNLSALQHKYRMSGASFESLCWMAQWRPSARTNTCLDINAGTTSRIVLRFHPSYVPAFKAALKQCGKPHGMHDFISGIQVAWRNSLPTPAGIVSASNRTSCLSHMQQQHSREGLLENNKGCGLLLLPQTGMHFSNTSNRRFSDFSLKRVCHLQESTG
jgi:hypothetical protein